MKRTFLRKSGSNGEMSLQITSMADIFMIILIFLLKSVGSGLIEVTPSEGVLVPAAHASDGTEGAMKFEVSENKLLLDGAVVAEMKGFGFKQGDLESDGSSRSLGKALDQVLGQKGDKKEEATALPVVIVADRRAPYATVKAVLATAATRGYTNFNLAVLSAN